MIDWHVQSEDSQYSVNLVYRFVPLNIDSLQVLTRYLTGIKHLCLAVGGPVGLLADAVVSLVIASGQPTSANNLSNPSRPSARRPARLLSSS